MNRAKKRLLLSGLLIAALVSTTGFGEALKDANKIIEKANLAAYYAGADGRSEVRMRIFDGQGREQRRQFTVLRRNIDRGKDQEFLVVFSYPSDVRGTAYLVKKHAGGDDDRWLYLPGLDLVKRISAGDKRTSFVGAHYFYEDVSGRSPQEDNHELIETTDTAYVLKHTPKDAAAVEFSSYVTWIDQETYLPMKIEYSNSIGQVYRRVEALEVKPFNGYPTVTESRVSNLETGGYTEMQFRFIAYDLGIPETLFTERSLRTPPRQWLKRPAKD